MILDGSKKSFTTALLDLELFGEISGLRLNSKKTEILWIGACTGRQDKLCPEKDFKWGTDKLEALGVWISSCLLYTSPSPRDLSTSRMPSSA